MDVREDGRSDDWELAFSLAMAALRLGQEERLAFLQAQCEQDTQLFAMVSRLLEEDSADGFAPPAVSPSAGDERAGAAALSSEASEPRDTGAELQVLRILGSGGQGAVWLARDGVGREVAVKRLHVSAQRGAARRFRREAETLAQIDHEHAPRLLSWGEESGTQQLVMQFIPGPSLQQLLAGVAVADELPLPPRTREQLWTLLEIFAELADALEHVHALGIVHRDVKPANVIMRGPSDPVLVDFGLARETEDALQITGTDMAVGSPYYMSPEQIRGKRAIDGRSDLFSLGVMLFECLTGERPFRGSTQAEIQRAILEQPLPDPRPGHPLVDRDLRAVLETATAKAPQERYASARALREDLLRRRRGESVSVQRVSGVVRAMRWTRRNKGAAGVGAVLLTALAVVTGFWIENARVTAELSLANQQLEAKSLLEQSRARELEALNQALRAKSEEAARNAERAQRQEELARSETEAVYRLSTTQDITDLLESQQGLWPAGPDKVEEMRAWVAAATELRTRLPELILARDRFRSQSSSSDPDPRGRFSDEQQARSWARWWNNQLTKLVAQLESLDDPTTGQLAVQGVSASDGWAVARRLRFAQRLQAGLAPGGELALRWELALPQIRRSYPGLELEPQMGLVPLGDDPESGLWEFWHLQSGTEPQRGEDGQLILEETSGLVLVLLPGGSFAMGAQSDDPDAENYEPGNSENGPVHPLRLSPFFLSKYEMTQGQWATLTGSNPSFYNPGHEGAGHRTDLRHPVEQVSWMDCTLVLGRLGMTLPSEAQWEYAARAGTSTPWWTGAEPESLAGAANLADAFAARNGGATWTSLQPWLDDGYAIHAPVDEYEPNPFGLHSVHGNLWEWCLDGIEEGFYSKSPELDPVCPPESSNARVYRGGCFNVAPALASSAQRVGGSPFVADISLGLRPCRPLQR